MPDIFVSEADYKKEEEKPEVKGRKATELAKSELKPESSEKKMGLLSTYCVNPDRVSFTDQEADETILLFLRRHLITNLDWFLIALILSSIPPVIYFLSAIGLTAGASIIGFSNEFITIFLIFYYSAIFTFMLVNLVSWFYNIGLVTTKRVVDIDLTELIFKNVATTQHTLIQDVSYSQYGAVRSFFNFGDVIVQTAGEQGKFELEAVPHPDRVVHLIEDFIGRGRRSGH